MSRKNFDDLFGAEAVHQGIAAQVSTLPSLALETITSQTSPKDLILMLDQVTDPHNVGAILRSAAAFGARAVITQERNSPDVDSPILAKTASGALEHVPLITVTNLARALGSLKKAGYWVAGLDERGTPLPQANPPRPLVVVLGAEGKGLRPLIQKECDVVLCLPTKDIFSTLNVSNAAAVALYALHANSSGE